MITTDFLRDSIVRFLRKASRARGVQPQANPENRVAAVEKAVAFRVGLSGEDSLDVFIIDISERVIDGDGFKIVIPIPNVVIHEASGDVALFVNKLNSRAGMVGKFVIYEDLTLKFALETLVPGEGDPAPELVEVALISALDAAVWFYAAFEEAAGPTPAPTNGKIPEIF